MNQYYEAVLQLRNAREDIIDFIISETKARGVSIAKTKRHKNGIDIYLSSKNFAVSVGKKLAAKFGGSLKISTRLFGMSRTGERLYRVSVLYIASEYKEGDVVLADGKIIRVRNIGKFVCGLDLKKWKNTKVLAKGKKIEKLEKFKTRVSKNYPFLEVIHPRTYQSVKVENPKETKKSRVCVVILNERVYLAE